MLYGSTSGVADGKRSTVVLGSNSYEAGEYSYELSGSAGGSVGNRDEMNGTGAESNGADFIFSGNRPLTACGTSRSVVLSTIQLAVLDFLARST